MIKIFGFLTLAAMTVAPFSMPASLAQDPESDPRGRLEEVTVTARRIQENMQTVPVAVNTMDAEEIRSLGIATARDVLMFTPGATTTTSTADISWLSLRGILSGNRGASEDSGVMVMVDGEVVSRGFMHNAVAFDLDRVEVLRGPQGTTYGRNATAGVINFINNRPTREFDAAAYLNVGNYNMVSAEGFVSGAISETVSARISAIQSRRDGYFDDLTTGRDVDGEENTSLRGQLLFEPAEDLSVLLKMHWSDFHSDHFAPRQNARHDIPMGLAAFTGWDFVRYDDEPIDPWTLSEQGDRPFGYDREFWGALLEIEKDFGEVSLISITTYRDGEDSSAMDLVGTPITFVNELVTNDAKTFSQEIRLNNHDVASRFGWQAGLYYLHEEHDRTSLTNYFDNLCELFPANCDSPPPFLGFLSLPTAEDLETEQGFIQSNETDSYGIFGEVSFDITDKTNIILGARYSDDKKDYSVTYGASGALSFIFVDDGTVTGDVSDGWDDLSGKISLSHQFTDKIMAYASFASAYKSGGFNAEPPNIDSLVSFDPEYVDTYEAGFKMDLFEDRFRLNLTVFDSDYDDIQATFIMPNGVAIASNVGEAEIQGIEVEGLGYLTDRLSLQFAYADYDHEYTRFDAGDSEDGDVVGNPVQNAPDWTATVALNYEIPLENGASIFLRGDYRGRGEINTRVTNEPESIRPSVDMYNALVKYTTPGAKWSVSLWGRNLTNEAEIVTIGPLISLFTQRSVVFGPPRTFGLGLEYKF